MEMVVPGVGPGANSTVPSLDGKICQIEHEGSLAHSRYSVNECR